MSDKLKWDDDLPDQKNLTVSAVAEYLNISNSTLYNMINRGEIGAIRVGKLYRIPAKELEKYLISNSTNSSLHKKEEER